MAKQILDSMNAGAGFEQVCSERMSKCMCRDAFLDASNSSGMFYSSINAIKIHMMSSGNASAGVD